MSENPEQEIVLVKKDGKFAGNDISWGRHDGIAMQLADHASGDHMAISAERLLATVQIGVDKVLADARAQKSHGSEVKARIEQHRAVFKKRKQARRQILQKVNANQASEPKTISSFNALPHFEYLEIVEAIGAELPSELNGFSSLDLSPQDRSEPRTGGDDDSLDELLAEPCAGNTTFSDDEDITDEYVVNAAARMLQQMSLSPTAESFVGYPLPETSNSEHSILGAPGPLDNELCCFVTCPIQETHCEGPYHYMGELGDQDHPYFKGSNPPPFVWDAYAKWKTGVSTRDDDEILGGFWAWHVPPFSTLEPDSFGT